MTEPADPQRFDSHLCLVSQQATPNLTPLLDLAFRPRRVVMVVTPDMRQRARWLEETLRRHRPPLTVECLEVKDAWDMHGVLDTLVGWLDSQPADCSIALNVTGGTKPMAMAAQQVFAMAGRPVFYVHQARAEIQWLEPRLPARTLGNRLCLEDYLHAHGWEVLARPALRAPDAKVAELTRELVLNIKDREWAIGKLNGYAQECERMNWTRINLNPGDKNDGAFMETLKDFERAGACRLDGDTLSFPDESARFFCKGGWLEDYVVELMRGLATQLGVQDWAAGLKVRSLDNNLKGEGGSNELDLAFLAHNRLHLVECKTSNLKDEGSATGAIYKLDALTALGGLNTTTLMVSYRKLADGERQRAKDLKIRTCVGTQLATLGATLGQWVGTRA